jgi:DNA-nicking Smr family endonuclease
MKNSIDYKKEADDYAEKMKYYFEESQKAWKNGDKAQAKNFSNMGNEFKANLIEANKKFQVSLEVEKEQKKKIQITNDVISEKTVFVNTLKDTTTLEINDIEGEQQNCTREDFLNAYKQYRSKSNDFGKQMQEAFEASQNAWKSGDKKKAKEYSDLGYECRQKMQMYNSKAVKLIVSSNNNGREFDEIDLHGLYVKEALEFFIKTANSKLVSKSIEFLKVITGKGLHSKEGPKIKQAIIEYCDKNALIVFEDSMNEGCLIVSLF